MADAQKSKITKGAAKSTSHAAVSRRAELRKNLRKPESRWRTILLRPDLTYSIPIALVFAILAGVLTAWVREQPLVEPGQYMTQTRSVRVPFRVENVAALEDKQRNARQNTARVYVAAPAVFDEIENGLTRLPTALADAQTLDSVASEIRETFQLTDAELAALRTEAVAGDASQAWRSKVEALVEQLYATPLLDNEAYQLEQTSGSRQWIEIRVPGRDPARLLKGRTINLASAQLATTLRQAVLQAGFAEPVASMIAGYLARNAKPTFIFDARATSAAQDASAAAVEPEYITYSVGHVIYDSGDRLTRDEYSLLLAEHKAYGDEIPKAALWGPRLGAMAESLLITIGLSLYIAAFCMRIRRNPLRVLAVAAMLLGALALAGVIAIQSPALIPLAASAPTAFVAGILVIAYNRGTALAIGSLHAALVVVALDQPATMMIPALAGVVAVTWTLNDVRHRNDLVRAGLATGATLAVAVAAVALMDRPLSPGLWRTLLIDSSWALGAGVAIGVVTLALLPTIERVFDIITGMTLIELRDPKQPLLRELQQRAPGTYNHSLAVANIAENAAEAVGAKSLHLYVGALYHDIGKMNKPDYFVENQSGGYNRHSKLSPAMSLLVIVGHVKDGIELAREYVLPRSLHHYIESHHGTTLVEYFFHQAQKQADEAKSSAPDEMEYRYPGPKPRTKEAAILMLTDAVESATRALKEPAPARIEALVRQLARKRLEDGQFDECDLTLRELQVIESSIIKSLTSIYHSRIAYPGADTKSESRRTSAAGEQPEAPKTDDFDPKSTQFEKTMSQSA